MLFKLIYLANFELQKEKMLINNTVSLLQAQNPLPY
jgi:hypothetical protein